MPKTALKPKTEEIKKSYKLLTRWCSRCVTTAPRKIVDQGEPDSVDSKFWKNHLSISSVCPGCKNEVTDFFSPNEIDNMESVGILR